MLSKGNKESKPQDTQEQKEENKSSSKKIISIFIGLDILLVIIIVLLLCLKGCKDNSGLPSNADQDSSIKYDYDVNKIDNVFKKIVKNQLFVDGFDEDTLTDVISVTFSDTSTSFDLNIEARSESKVYYYQLSNYPYSGFDNFVPYLLSLDLNTKLSLNEGSISLNTYLPTLETITADKQCKYLISTDVGATNKYFDGFYFKNNQYYVYQHQVLDDDNPFNKDPNQVIGLESPLYGYYQSLSI